MAYYSWGISPAKLIEAIRVHLERGYRLYHKNVSNPLEGFTFFDANVALFPDSNDEDDDVYVEFRVSNRRIYVEVRVAHDHPTSGRRYPKN